jgi:hypothetical protein
MRFHMLVERMEIKFSKVGQYEYPCLLFLDLYTVYWFTLIDALKKDVVGFSETLVTFYQATGFTSSYNKTLDIMHFTTYWFCYESLTGLRKSWIVTNENDGV